MVNSELSTQNKKKTLIISLRRSALQACEVCLTISTTLFTFLFCFIPHAKEERKPVFKALLTIWKLILNFAHAWLHAHFAFSDFQYYVPIMITCGTQLIYAWIIVLRCSTSSSSKTNLLVKPLTNVILGPLVSKIPSTTGLLIMGVPKHFTCEVLRCPWLTCSCSKLVMLVMDSLLLISTICR